MNLLKNVLFAVPLLLSSSKNYGQAPNLGAASSFAVFTAAGAINSYDTTLVTGNIGTNVGAFNGFPPGIVAGETHVADPTSAQAAIAVESAYSYLSGVSCGQAIGATLGNDQVLTANTYCLGAASLNGNLTLDGQGDMNALFIIQIDGAFSTTVSSNIILINSASAHNIYWQVNGMVTLADNTIFKGNIVADGTIILLEKTILQGRVLTRAGAIELHNNNIIIALNPAPLPVELILFTAELAKEKSTIDLRWQTASEFNSARYIIETSTDGTNFKTIGERAAAGQSNQLLSYFFKDEHPVNGNNFYRLNQIDINGMQEYSAIRVVRFTNSMLPVELYPNPVKGNEVFVDISQLNSTDNVTISWIDIYGRILRKEIFDYNPQILLHLPETHVGTYCFLRIEQGESIQDFRLLQLP